MKQLTLDQITDLFDLPLDDRELLQKMVKHDEALRAEAERQRAAFVAWVETVRERIEHDLTTDLRTDDV